MSKQFINFYVIISFWAKKKENHTCVKQIGKKKILAKSKIVSIGKMKANQQKEEKRIQFDDSEKLNSRLIKPEVRAVRPFFILTKIPVDWQEN